MALGGIGDTVKSATDAATKNVVGDAIDAVAGDLAGQAGKATPGEPHYIKGACLDPDAGGGTDRAVQNEASGSDSGGNPPYNVLDAKPPLEFVHLSYAHADGIDHFPGEAGSHGIAFRDALVREDVLLYAFARSAQRVLTQVKASKGAAGAMLETAGSLLGGGKQASQGPEAIDPILTQLRAAIDPINTDAPTYTDIHAAGVKLTEAWASFNVTCMSALKPGSGGGLGLPTLPGANLIPGAVPDVVKKIPEWLFKAQDAYMAMFSEARTAFEWPLMQVVHDYSVQAIEQDWRPTFDIWFLRDAPAAEGEGDAPRSAPENLLQDAQDGLNSVPSYGSFDPGGDAASPVGSLKDSIAGARGTARDKLGDIGGFLATAESELAKLPPEAGAALSQAFSVLKAPHKDFPNRSALSVALEQGMASALLGQDKRTLPGFMQFHLDITSDITLTLLPKVYAHIMGRYGTPEPSLVVAAVHDAVAERVVDMIWALIFGKGTKPGSNQAKAERKRGTDIVDNLGQGQFGTGGLVPGMDELENKAADLVHAFLRSQGRYLNGVILFLATDLLEELLVPWLDTLGRKALTMETYIGHLPRFAALLARNLTFPMFNLLLKVFGMADHFAGMAWDPVREKIGQAGMVANTVKGAKDDVRETGEDVQRGAHAADREIATQQALIQNDASALSQGGSVTDLASAQQFARDKGTAFNKLSDDAGHAPDKVMDAATRKELEDAGVVIPKDTGIGPLSAERKAGGSAVAIDPGEVKKVGYVNVEDEAVAAAGRAAPPKAQAPPTGPDAPRLPGSLPF
jgi:hypothetical protein